MKRLNLTTLAVRALPVFLLAGTWTLSAGAGRAASVPSAQRAGESQMAQDDRTTETDKNKQKSTGKPDMVNTPAGPVPRERVHEVKPGEVLRRNKDGTYTKVPKSN